MNGKAFREAMIEIPPPPCETCEWMDTCGEHELACEMFFQYCGYGARDKKERRHAKAEPSRIWHRLVFTASDGIDLTTLSRARKA